MSANINKIFEYFGFKDFRLITVHITQLSWMIWGQFISLVLGFVSIKLTTAIGASEYGNYILVVSIGGLLSLSFFGPFEQGFIRFYFEFTKSEEERSTYIKFVAKILKLSFAFLLFGAIITVFIGINFFNINILFLVSASFLIIFSVLSNPLNGLLNAMKLRKEIAVIQILEKICIIIFLLLIGLLAQMDAALVMLSIACATGFFFAVRLKTFLKQAAAFPTAAAYSTIKKTTLPRIITFCIPFIAWGWLAWLQLNGERWVINSFLPKEDVGKYGLSLSLINNSIVLAYGVFIQFITPSIYEKFSGNNESDDRKGHSLITISSAITLSMFVVFGIFIFFFGENLIHLLSSEEYVVDSSILLLITTGLGFFYIGQTFAIHGMALQKPSIYLIPKILSALISIVGYIYFCKLYGILGIAIAICISGFVYMISVNFANRKLLHSR